MKETVKRTVFVNPLINVMETYQQPTYNKQLKPVKLKPFNIISTSLINPVEQFRREWNQVLTDITYQSDKKEYYK